MSDLMKRILEGKEKSRQQLAALSFEEKVALVEKMRDRSLAIASSPLRRQIQGTRSFLKPAPCQTASSCKRR
jgi:hypothetical protein